MLNYFSGCLKITMYATKVESEKDSYENASSIEEKEKQQILVGSENNIT